MIETILRRRRSLNLAGAGLCAALVAFAIYLQFGQQMEPCPLCIFQRMVFVAMAAVFLVAGLHAPRRGGRYGYAGAFLITGAVGVALSGRHIYLQSLPPDQVPSCGPGLEYMLDVLPLMETIQQVLMGSGECAEVDRVLGVSIPLWTLLAFLALTVMALAINLARPPEDR